MRERFLDLLPWYVNGTLAASDLAWVEAYLRQHPEAQREVQWHIALRDEVCDAAPDVPPTIGLAGALARIESERTPRRRRSAVQRLRSILFGWRAAGSSMSSMAGLHQRPAFVGGLLALVVVQAAVLGALWRDRAEQDALTIRSSPNEPSAAGPLLALVFASSATEQELRLLLVDVQGSLVGGPGQLGKYYVRVPAGTEQAAVTALRGKPQVESVEVVAGVPLAR